MEASRVLRQLRTRLRSLLGRAIARLMGPKGSSAALVPEKISSILVCRINGRLGNTVFLTALLKCIHELLPDAAVDVATAYPQANDLFAGFPKVRRVIAFPHKGIGMIRRYFRALRAMRAERYDLAIDPVPESTSGRIAITLCRARHRVGFATASQWAPLTHAIPAPDFAQHQAIQPVSLLCQALGKPCRPRDVRLSLCLRPEEIAAGRSEISNAIDRGATHRVQIVSSSSRAFAFFAHAKGPKNVEPAWWLAFWESFLKRQPDTIPIEVLPTPTSAALRPDFRSIHCTSPRGLTAAIAATRMFISADTGPMHLASSTSVPTVGLFCSSDPTLYGPLKPTDLVFNVAHTAPWVVAEQCQRLWQQTGAEDIRKLSRLPALGAWQASRR